MTTPIHTNIRFDNHPPRVGERSIDRGQIFEIVEVRPHIRRDGSATKILVWQAPCAECGETFTTTTPRVAEWITKRCPNHAVSGQRIRRQMGTAGT